MALGYFTEGAKVIHTPVYKSSNGIWYSGLNPPVEGRKCWEK